jgi:hypothetical protein
MLRLDNTLSGGYCFYLNLELDQIDAHDTAHCLVEHLTLPLYRMSSLLAGEVDRLVSRCSTLEAYKELIGREKIVVRFAPSGADLPSVNEKSKQLWKQVAQAFLLQDQGESTMSPPSSSSLGSSSGIQGDGHNLRRREESRSHRALPVLWAWSLGTETQSLPGSASATNSPRRTPIQTPIPTPALTPAHSLESPSHHPTAAYSAAATATEGLPGSTAPSQALPMSSQAEMEAEAEAERLSKLKAVEAQWRQKQATSASLPEREGERQPSQPSNGKTVASSAGGRGKKRLRRDGFL